MPVILDSTQINLERLDLARRSPIVKPTRRGLTIEPTRHAGIHLSGVLRYVAVTGNLLKVIDDIDEEELPLRWALGLAWEEFAVSLYPDTIWQPGEMVVDDVAMNCDGHSALNMPDGGLHFCLEEFKLTWKKVKTAEEILREQWYWMQQGRGYCWGYGANYVRWHVCFINGDYRGSGPIYMRYLIHFSESDVESTRQMVEKYKHRAKPEGEEEETKT